ncbi:uncharacterized protein HD556DRAFT_1451703 [Suillus plorans]|uniref:Uncharacterized protein n=1 Tax=Suillus plorans TaxID=116603 RepID=A0A9P7A8L0_9AGAM|nr:uncharacterized protein HD556DRAFT_1451703 [Suillus plorans]KAG1784504.1 hypothetical protein HD556DRAFT_1451703 [Suillus plorans]
MTSNVPIALEIKPLSDPMNEVLLSHAVSLEVEHNTHILKIGGTDDKIKVSPKCLDQIRLVVHQLHLYQRTAKALTKVAKSDRVEETFVFYMSLISYFAVLITAFLREAKADSSSSNSKWRSAYLDYHMALALHGNSFTLDQQIVAMQDIKRSWNQFREKKVFKKVQELHGKRMHDTFCVEGDNMCGGLFEHQRSEDDMITAIIDGITSEVPDHDRDDVDAPAPEDQTSERPKSAGITPGTPANPSQPDMEVDVDPADLNVSGTRTAISASIYVKKAARMKDHEDIDGSGHSKKDVIHTDDESITDQIASRFEKKSDSKKSPKGRRNSRKGKAKASQGKKNVIESPMLEAESDVDLNLPISDPLRLTAHDGGSSKIDIAVADVDVYNDESITDTIATRFENNEELRNPSKERKNVWKGKGKKSYGKQKAPESPLLEVESEQEESPHMPHPVFSLTDNDVTSRMDISDLDAEGYEKGLLPPNQDKWEALTRLAFEKGNSQVFLKLATWMLVRFRDLTNRDMDSELDGLLISENPRLLEFDDDRYFEAVGMERLYSAIVHMEARPRYLCHLFHALGKRLTESDVGTSNPRIWPSRSPPAVQREMMTDMELPWLGINTDITADPWLAFTNVTDDDAEGSVDMDGRDVTLALDSMIIEDDDLPIHHGTDAGISRLEKRKRTLSQASPPKKDGGRGTPKRCKNGSQTNVTSSSIIQYSSDIDQSGFINSPTLPLSSHMSSVSSQPDNVSDIMEAWDDPIQANTNDNETAHRDATQPLWNVPDDNHIEHGKEDQNDRAKSTYVDRAGSASPVILVPGTQPSPIDYNMDTTAPLPQNSTIMTEPEDSSPSIHALPVEPSTSVGSTCTEDDVTPPRTNSYHNSQIELVGENDPPPHLK